MSRFDSGVNGYIYAEATVRVSFPIDFKGNATVCCNLCPYYKRNYRSCALNGIICEFPDQYIGSHCPLNFISEEGDFNV